MPFYLANVAIKQTQPWSMADVVEKATSNILFIQRYLGSFETLDIAIAAQRELGSCHESILQLVVEVEYASHMRDTRLSVFCISNIWTTNNIFSSQGNPAERSKHSFEPLLQHRQPFPHPQEPQGQESRQRLQDLQRRMLWSRQPAPASSQPEKKSTDEPGTLPHFI